MQLVTYNIQYGTGKDGAADLSRIASEIASAMSSPCRKLTGLVSIKHDRPG